MGCAPSTVQAAELRRSDDEGMAPVVPDQTPPTARSPPVTREPHPPTHSSVPGHDVEPECSGSDKSWRSSKKGGDGSTSVKPWNETAPGQPTRPSDHGNDSVIIIWQEKTSAPAEDDRPHPVTHEGPHSKKHSLDIKAKPNPLSFDLGIPQAEVLLPQPMPPPEFLDDSKSDSAWNVELAEISGVATRDDDGEEPVRTETPQRFAGSGSGKCHPAAASHSHSTATTDLRPKSLGFVSIEPPDPQFWQGKLTVRMGGSITTVDLSGEVKPVDQQYCPAETLVVSVTHWLALCSESVHSGSGTAVGDSETAKSQSVTEFT